MLKISGYPFGDLTADDNICSDDTLILPGVGSFSEGMSYLNDNSLANLIQSHACSGGKIVAICLGLQLLFRTSEESPGVDGLKIFDGHVVKLPTCHAFNVPHIGWNQLCKTSYTPQFLSKFFEEDGVSLSDYYFVHSYYAVPLIQQDSIATIKHPQVTIDVAFRQDNVYAFQFHPEKSGPSGYQLLKAIINK